MRKIPKNANAIWEQSKGNPIEIDGLWGIAFPPAASLNNTYLYFAAGPGTEQHGLMGYIKNLYLN